MLSPTSGTYTDTFSIPDVINGGSNTFDVVVTITGSDDLINFGTGSIGVGDSVIGGGETLDISAVFTPQTPGVSIDTFSLDSFSHGGVTSDPTFPFGNAVAASGSAGGVVVLPSQGAGDADLTGVNGFGFLLETSGTGSISGLSGFSFTATSVPEPSSLLLCGVFAGFGAFRRRRSVTSA